MKRKGVRVLCCGARDWFDYKTVLSTLKKYHESHTIEAIIEGEANGADKLARKAGKKLKIPVLPFKANWKAFGRAAGPIRNCEMLYHGKPDVVIAFHKNLKRSKGTKSMVELAKKKGLKIIRIRKAVL